MSGTIVGGVLGSGFAGACLTAYITTRVVVYRIGQASRPPAYQVTGRLVTVVIPTLMEEDYLPKLLETIRNQTYQPIEIVVAVSSPPSSHATPMEISET